MSYTSNTTLVPRVKTLRLVAASAVSTVLLASVPALAEDAGAPPHKSVCLDSYRIDHTEVLNNHQILFYMVGKEVWVNNLPSPCSTLDRTEGFVWKSSTGQYCDNLETISVIRTGQTCLLGAFTPYQKPAKPS